MGVDCMNHPFAPGLPPGPGGTREERAEVGAEAGPGDTSLIRNRPTLGPFGRPMPRALWLS